MQIQFLRQRQGSCYHSQPNVRRECHQVGETSARVKELYTEGGPEADESTNIFFVSVISNFFGSGQDIRWIFQCCHKVCDVTENKLDASLKSRYICVFFIYLCRPIPNQLIRIFGFTNINLYLQTDSPRQRKHRAFEDALGRLWSSCLMFSIYTNINL